MFVNFNTSKLPRGEDWCNPIEGFLDPNTFEILADEYPSKQIFELFHIEHERKKEVQKIPGYQCSSRYRMENSKAVRDKLSNCWESFLTKIEDPYGPYLAKIREMFEVPFEVRFSWHLGYDGFFITPHRDARRKLATHLFYFNREGQWQSEWGGNLCRLSAKVAGSDEENPTFEDFQKCEPLPMLNNSSVFLYRNEESWHGVKPMRCDPNRYRLAFNVIFERINYGS